MIVHNFDPVLIDFGLFQIRWYSIAYILGIVLGWVYAIKVIIKRKKNTNNFEIIKKSDFDDLIIYLVLGIILGIFATALYTTLREWTLVIPGYVVLGGIVSSILIGGLAGFYPALRAANMSPTDALRTK